MLMASVTMVNLQLGPEVTVKLLQSSLDPQYPTFKFFGFL